jgi:predicted kinase
MPGAGKSTLARRLASSACLPVLDRDDFKDVMFDVLGWSDRDWSRRVGAASFDLLFLLMRRLLEGNASFIAETNFGPRELPSLEPIRASFEARWVEVFVVADPTICAERMAARRRSGNRHPGHNPGGDLASDYLPGLTWKEWCPVGLADRLVAIDTTDDREPSLEAVLEALT